MAEPPMMSIPCLVEAIVPAIAERPDLPAVFFGHSMGAVIAVEVARKLMIQALPPPIHIFVSGRRPPHMPDPMLPLHKLSDEDFVAEINRRYGGIPSAILDNPDVLALMLPALRADITALETFPAKPRTPVSVPITVFGGDRDLLTPRSHLEAWKSETTRPIEIRLFPGGHFYLERESGTVIRTMLKTVLPLLDRMRPQDVLAWQR